jgi:hypothetical protein
MKANNVQIGGTLQRAVGRTETDYTYHNVVNVCALTADGSYISTQCWEGAAEAAGRALDWIDDTRKSAAEIVTVVLAVPNAKECRRYEPTNPEHLAALRAMAGR